MHGMAFEFLGGKAHCGRPWHRFGAPFALVDCVDHEAGGGCGAVLDNALYGKPARCHDSGGWPTFTGWPDHKSLTHEQSYWRWLERAWHGGMRLYVNLMVENRALCELYPLKQNSCNEMESVLLQIQRIHEFQDYIDAQAGGPGKGFFRIVESPFEAREVINRGKLAVVLGMEVSEPFGCSLQFGAPMCDEAEIDGWLDRLDQLGIRQLEITNKFDNALTGVKGDNGEVGTVVNAGNFYTTGRFWDMESCDDPENHDNTPTGAPEPHNEDLIIANGFDAFTPPGVLPTYSEPPNCNKLGLTPLGEHAIRGIIDREMIFDPDHMSLLGRNQALNLVESKDYSGIFSSHSWSTPNALPRIYELGGVITPSSSEADDFVHEWQHLRQDYSGRQYFGVGYGADQNGFATQPGPRDPAAGPPVGYPFKSFDGEVTLDRQVSGERAFDINVDGIAHYGLYPDWIEDLRQVGGKQIVRDMGRGAEAYLQMWERAEGIEEVRCDTWRQRFLTARGLPRRIQLGYDPRTVLERAGQPVRRTRVWRWCANERGGAAGGEGQREGGGAVRPARPGRAGRQHPAQAARRRDPARNAGAGAAPRHRTFHRRDPGSRSGSRPQLRLWSSQGPGQLRRGRLGLDHQESQDPAAQRPPRRPPVVPGALGRVRTVRSARLIAAAVALAVLAVPASAVAQEAPICLKIDEKLDDGRNVWVGTNQNDSVTGLRGKDKMNAGKGNDHINGGRDNDVVKGGPGDDILCGGRGTDKILGGSGNDTIFGEEENDTIVPGPGDDRVLGSAGDDRIYGWGRQGGEIVEDGIDILDGGFNDDILEAGGADSLFGFTHDDILRTKTPQTAPKIMDGGGNDDQVFGSEADDVISGGKRLSGDDKLRGAGGNDVIRGEGNNDKLYGQVGDDRLFGGDGLDFLNGGAGDDLCDGGGLDDRAKECEDQQGIERPFAPLFSSIR